MNFDYVFLNALQTRLLNSHFEKVPIPYPPLPPLGRFAPSPRTSDKMCPLRDIAPPKTQSVPGAPGSMGSVFCSGGGGGGGYTFCPFCQNHESISESPPALKISFTGGGGGGEWGLRALLARAPEIVFSSIPVYRGIG